MIENVALLLVTGRVFDAGAWFVSGGSILSDGGRVVCAVGLGNEIKDAQSRAYELGEKRSWDTAYFRTDIGFKAR